MKYYSIATSAKILGIQVRTLREWIKNGKIKAEKDTNGWYWKISEDEIKEKITDDHKD